MQEHPQRLCQVVLVFVIASVLGLMTPGTAKAQLGRTPLPPLAAWEVADDGSVYVLDAAQQIYELDGQTLAPRSASGRLHAGLSGSAAQIAAGDSRLYVPGAQTGGIQVLDRQTLEVVATIGIDAAALAIEPGGRLFVIERTPLEAMPQLYSFRIVTLPLDDMNAQPQAFGPTATQPFSSLFDLVVDSDLGLLFVGYQDTSGSPNRHYRTYRAYDLQSGEEVDLGIEHQSASTALRPAISAVDIAVISYDWEGVYPSQQRLYLIPRDAKTTMVENLSGPLAIDESGRWLYVIRERGLWVLEASTGGGYTLRSVIPFLVEAPAGVRLAPDGQTLYLFGNGWLAALDATELQAAGVEPVAPFPLQWTAQKSASPQTPRLFTAADDGDVELRNLQPSNEWYRSSDSGASWQLLPAVQYPDDLGLDRLSLSPSMAQDGIVAARGGWQDEQRTTWRSQDTGQTWARWTPPIVYTAGNEGATTLYVLEQDGEPQPIPTGGTSENPSWASGWTHLAFQNNITGDWEIYRAPVECSASVPGPSAAATECDVQRLTDSTGDDLLPAWSPDGRMIAFVSLRDGNPEIYVMLADGTQQTRLTFAPGGDWRPAWLPDSRHLVFTSDRGGTNDIFLLETPWQLGNNASEGTVRAVIAGPADERDPAVNGDGELLYLSDADSVMQPYTVDLASFLQSGSRTPLTGSPALEDVAAPVAHPGWLPDGNLLFASGQRIYTAERYTGPDEWQPLTPADTPAHHPNGGAPWYWPEPGP